MISKMSNDLKL